MSALDRLDPNGQGVSRQKVMDESGLSRGRLQRAVTRMREEGLLEEIPVKVRVGNGAERSADGLRRRANDGGG